MCCSRLPLHVRLSSPFAVQIYQAAELEMLLHRCSQYLENYYDTSCELVFYFNSTLSRYSKPIYPSPLAFILLPLELFLFGIALFFRWWFLVVPDR